MKEVIIDGVKYVREDSLVVNRSHILAFLDQCFDFEYLNILGETIDRQIKQSNHAYSMIEDMMEKGDSLMTKKLFMIHIALNDL